MLEHLLPLQHAQVVLGVKICREMSCPVVVRALQVLFWLSKVTIKVDFRHCENF